MFPITRTALKGCLMMALLLVGGVASAATLTFTWTNPVVRESGAALTPAELSTYEILMNDAAISTGAATITSAVYLIPEGQCVAPTAKFSARVKDTGNTWSKASLPPITIASEVCTKKSAPGAPGNVKITVTP